MASRPSRANLSQFAIFSIRTGSNCGQPYVLRVLQGRKEGLSPKAQPKDSPSRERFRPPSRRTFRFRVVLLGGLRPTGAPCSAQAETYEIGRVESRPVRAGSSRKFRARRARQRPPLVVFARPELARERLSGLAPCASAQPSQPWPFQNAPSRPLRLSSGWSSPGARSPRRCEDPVAVGGVDELELSLGCFVAHSSTKVVPRQHRVPFAQTNTAPPFPSMRSRAPGWTTSLTRRSLG